MIEPLRQNRAFPFDPEMPELPLALDPAIVGPLLGKRILTAGPHGEMRQACRVIRIRYRPRERCVVQYELTTADLADQVHAQRYFVTGTLFADARRAARRAARSGTQYLPELRMQFSVFPGDPKLPQARTLLNGTDAHLQAAILQSFGLGDWQIERSDTDVVRYREGLSLVLRVTATARERATATRTTRVVYVKAYPQVREATNAFAHLTAVSRLVAEKASETRVDEPFACIEHLSAIVLKSAEGRSLSEMIESVPLEAAILATRRSALAMAHLHACRADGLKVYDAVEFGRSLQRPLRILGWAQPGLKPKLGDIVERVTSLPTSELAPTHRDMKPEHVVLDSRNVTLIDLDSCAAADPVLDVALMLARLEALAQGPGCQIAAHLAATFERTYFSVAPRSRRRRLPLLLAGSLVEVAAGLFHRQEENWRERVPALIESAYRHAVSSHREPTV